MNCLAPILKTDGNFCWKKLMGGKTNWFIRLSPLKVAMIFCDKSLLFTPTTVPIPLGRTSHVSDVDLVRQ
jgi:hypothetical protein